MLFLLTAALGEQLAPLERKSCATAVSTSMPWHNLCMGGRVVPRGHETQNTENKLKLLKLEALFAVGG